MQYCPKCKTEYEDHADMCVDCDLQLVPNLEEHTYMKELVRVKKADSEKMLKYLQRLYWYTIEFGLIKQNNNIQIYGAGILSSFGESKHIYSDNVKILPFDIDWIVNHDLGLLIKIIVFHEFVVVVKWNSKTIGYRSIREPK